MSVSALDRDRRGARMARKLERGARALAIAAALGIPVALIAAILAGPKTALLFALGCAVGLIVALTPSQFNG